MHAMKLRTPRLLINGFSVIDAQQVATLAGDYDVARFTMNIPHPYELNTAKEWISSHDTLYRENTGIVFAIRSLISTSLMGCIGLSFDADHHRGELGYWMGKEYWGKGYCTEAAIAVIEFSFNQFALNKITSRHLENNPASGRIMEKIGMKKEGILKEEIYKEGLYHNIHVFGLLKTEHSNSVC